MSSTAGVVLQGCAGGRVLDGFDKKWELLIFRRGALRGKGDL